MKKSRWTVTFAAGLVVAGIGIGAAAYLASTQVEAQSTGLPATLAYMPATTTVVGHIDFTSLMSSPLREKWEEELERTGLNEFREKTGLDPFNDLYGASFAVVTPKDTSADAPPSMSIPERWGVAIHGAFDAELLLAKVRENATIETETYESTTIYRVTPNLGTESGDASSRLNPAFAFAGIDTLLFGEPEYLKEMLDAGAGRAPSAGASIADRWGEGHFAQDTFWVAASPEQGLGQVIPQGANIPPIQSFAFSGRLDAELALRAKGQAADSEAATKLADVVRGFVALGSLQKGENPDLGVILDSIQIEQVDNEVAVSLSVPYETLERLSQRAQTQAEDKN